MVWKTLFCYSSRGTGYAKPCPKQALANLIKTNNFHNSIKDRSHNRVDYLASIAHRAIHASRTGRTNVILVVPYLDVTAEKKKHSFGNQSILVCHPAPESKCKGTIMLPQKVDIEVAQVYTSRWK